MLTIDPSRSLLLVVDFQSRLLPAIHDGATAVRNVNRLIEAAKIFGIPRLFTEQNAKGPARPSTKSPSRRTAWSTSSSSTPAGRTAFSPACPLTRMSLSRAASPTSACSRRCSVCCTRPARSTSRATRWDPDIRRTRRPRSAGWNATARRSSRPRWWYSNGCRRRTTHASGRRSRPSSDRRGRQDRRDGGCERCRSARTGRFRRRAEPACLKPCRSIPPDRRRIGGILL